MQAYQWGANKTIFSLELVKFSSKTEIDTLELMVLQAELVQAPFSPE